MTPWLRGTRATHAVTMHTVALALWAAAAVLATMAVALYVSAPEISTEDRERVPMEVLPAVVATVLACATVGALVATRHPYNPIGWLFAVLGASLAAVFAISGWAEYALVARQGAVPGGELAAWALSWAFLVPLVLVPTLLFLLFPTGRPVSPGWGRLGWLAAGATLTAAVSIALRPGELPYDPPVQNPLGVGGSPDEVLAGAASAAQVVAVLLLPISALGMAVRFRRARGDERVQLKWLLSAATLVAVTATAAAIGPTEGLLADLLWLAALLAFLCVPLAAGVAILRYRLYDIDLVIKRTLVYGSLTAMLVAAYLLIVLLLRLALRPVAGESDLAVAASTLAVAALFRPLRARIQTVVDRRFYRSRYDAERTLEVFTGRLRDELDLTTLGSDLRGVVHQTLQPTHVSLWFREAP